MDLDWCSRDYRSYSGVRSGEEESLEFELQRSLTSFAGLAVAIQNAPGEVKAVADYITLMLTIMA